MTSLLKERSQLKTAIRSFFVARDYLEIDTPMMVHMPGAEVHLDYFSTEWLDIYGKPHELYLRSSPELHMKRAVAAGYGNVFQLAPSFRNAGEFSDWHHPEFTMLEWYRPSGTLSDLISETSQLVSFLATDLGWRSAPTDIPVFTVAELFESHAQLDPFAPDFLARAKRLRPTNIHEGDDAESAFFKIMLDIIEPALRAHQACFVWGFPASTASLATVTDGVAQRAELYLQGVEVANGFQELTGSDDNRQRIAQINKLRYEAGKPLPPVDEAFVQQMERLGPCCGNALGFDRLLAWLLGRNNIDDVIPFRSDLSP